MTMNCCRRNLFLVLCCGFWLLTGCSLSLSPLSKRSAAFGNSAALAVKNSSDAYQKVESTRYQAQVATLVLNFDRDGFDASKITPFLTPHDLEVRQTILKGLGDYADQLADVAGGKAFDSLNTQSAALSNSLSTLSKNDELQKLAPASSDSEVKGLATAINVLGRVLIERKRRKELPRIISEMQPVLDQITALLIADIGDRPHDGKAGRGLRAQLWRQYDSLIGAQEDFIANNAKTLTPGDKRTEVAKLPQLFLQQQAADDTFARTETTLRDMDLAHKALLEPEQTGTFKTRLSELVEDGQQVASFYTSLNAH